MKIGIEAQRIFRKKKHGMDMVAIQLVRHLQKIDTTNEYFIFVKPDEDESVIKETENFQIVPINGGPYPYWEQVLLPKTADALGVHLLHTTSNTAPLNWKKRLVITLHDIIYLESINLTKGSWYQRIGNLYRRWNVPKAVRRASHVITVSDYERNTIERRFRLGQSLTTVYNAAGDHFAPVADKSILDEVRKKYKLPEHFIFYLGNTDPKKNLPGVLKALSVLRRKGQLNIPLLMLDIDRNFLTQSARAIGDEEILSAIQFTGYVPNEELPAIYSLARMFIYPSLRESFGIPILEAMSCGTPVITSNTSSMPEVGSDAAYYIDPNDSATLADAIEKLHRDEALREDLISKGFSRARHFSWKHNAEQTLRIYNQLLKT